jgi:hypothetical protein
MSDQLLRHLNVIQTKRLAAERDAKDYAIEFGGYLANEAERFMEHHNSKQYAAEAEADIGDEKWSALQSAIYEFRKRAEKAKP